MTNNFIIKPSFAGTYDIKLKDGHCIVNAGIGENWLTIYLIETEAGYRGHGEATRLLTEIRDTCAKFNRDFKVWCPLTDTMVRLCKKLNIETV